MSTERALKLWQDAMDAEGVNPETHHVRKSANGHTAKLDAAALRAITAALAERDDVVGAAIALRDDMIMRAEMNKHLNGGEVVVEAGIGVWRRFCAALKSKDRP